MGQGALRAPYDDAPAGTGARRAALALTLGFGLGAGVAGVLAQWGPWPMELPYVVHVVLTAAVLPLLVRVPETVPGGTRRPAPIARAVRHPRFLRVVVPMAPWIFGSAGVAYAIMPQLVGDRLGSWGSPTRRWSPSRRWAPAPPCSRSPSASTARPTRGPSSCR
ncbi:hypothetical protein ACFQV8_15245 [Pseudonocardia benzenivorans]